MQSVTDIKLCKCDSVQLYITSCTAINSTVYSAPPYYSTALQHRTAAPHYSTALQHRTAAPHCITVLHCRTATYCITAMSTVLHCRTAPHCSTALQDRTTAASPCDSYCTAPPPPPRIVRYHCSAAPHYTTELHNCTAQPYCSTALQVCNTTLQRIGSSRVSPLLFITIYSMVISTCTW